MFQEKAEYFSRGIRAARIGKGSGAAAARPCMAGAMDDPLLENRLSARIGMKRAAIGMPCRHLTMLNADI